MTQKTYTITGKTNLLKNYVFTTPIIQDGVETGEYEPFLGHKIIVRLPDSYTLSNIGLFINNNPYLIRSNLNGTKQWELDTKGTVSIKSIKFDYTTAEKIGSKIVYITVFQD